VNITQFVTLAFLFVITLVNYIKYRDALYPPVLQGALWFIVTFIFILDQHSFIPVSDSLYFIIVSGVIIFSMGSYIASSGCRISKKQINDSELSYNKKVVELFFWISLLGLPVYIYKAYMFGSEGIYDSFFMNLRDITSATDNSMSLNFGIFMYFLPVSFISTWMLTLTSSTRREKTKLYVSFLISLMYAFLTMGRAVIMLLVITMLGILLITRRISPIKAATSFGLIGAFMFILIGALLAKGIDAEQNLAANAISMWESFRVYLLGALPAFDVYTRQDIHGAYGENVFRTIFVIINKFYPEVTFPRLIREFVLVPFSTNVYTIYQPYYNDFSFYGVFGIQFVVGLWHGYLYKKATSHDSYFIMLYAVFLFPLFMQFFQDQYMSLLSLWIQLCVGLFVCNYKIQISRTINVTPNVS